MESSSPVKVPLCLTRAGYATGYGAYPLWSALAAAAALRRRMRKHRQGFKSTWDGMGGPARIGPYLLFQRFRPGLLSSSLVISSVNPFQQQRKTTTKHTTIKPNLDRKAGPTMNEERYLKAAHLRFP